MTTRLILLAAAALLCWAAPLQGQTIKSLGYNTTNGTLVYTGTNDFRLPATIRIGTNQAGISSGGQFLSLTDGDGGVSMQLGTNAITVYDKISFGGAGGTASSNAATTRTNLGLPLEALTNTSNVTAMRALAGSTNTNEPFSGSIALTNTNTLVFSNGILLSQ
jgi:hypothetical protein